MAYDNIAGAGETTVRLRLPQEWMEERGDRIMDHDGWRAGVPGYPGGKQWDVPISEDEYVARFDACTVYRRSSES